jgi:hypothetical protein
MGPPSVEDLDGVSQIRKFPDGTVVRVFCTRTRSEAYPSGWAYTLHYGALEPDVPRTLEDGTIRRYDNAHEQTKGHELHAAPNSEPQQIAFPGMARCGNGSGARFRNPNSMWIEHER